jgi:hypothetical protein
VANDTLAKEFQRRYLEGDSGALSGLYAESRHIAYILAKDYCKRYGLWFTDEKIDDAVQAALSRILARFTPGPYKIRSFYQVIHKEIMYELSNGHGRINGPKAELLNGILSLEAIPEPAGEPEKSNGDRRGYFKDILSGPNGKRIIVDLWRNRVYRESILAIDEYCTRDFIRINASRLAYIFRVMHGKEKRNNGKHISGNMGRNSTSSKGDKSLQGKG